MARLESLHYLTLQYTKPYLLNKSFNSCSDENCPRLATNKVEHGEFDDTPLRPGELAEPFTAGSPCMGLVKIGVAPIAPIVGCGNVAEIIVGWNWKE